MFLVYVFNEIDALIFVTQSGPTIGSIKTPFTRVSRDNCQNNHYRTGKYIFGSETVLDSDLVALSFSGKL